MDRVFALGLLLTAVGVVGYAAGLVAPYEGRAFSVTAVMAGITLAAIGSADRGEEVVA